MEFPVKKKKEIILRLLLFWMQRKQQEFPVRMAYGGLNCYICNYNIRLCVWFIRMRSGLWARNKYQHFCWFFLHFLRFTVRISFLLSLCHTQARMIHRYLTKWICKKAINAVTTSTLCDCLSHSTYPIICFFVYIRISVYFFSFSTIECFLSIKYNTHDFIVHNQNTVCCFSQILRLLLGLNEFWMTLSVQR